MQTDEISGKWIGHYRHGDEQCEIEAIIQQDCAALTGTMVDARTTSRKSVFEMAQAAGLPPGSDEKMEKQIRQLMPDAGNEPIQIETILPSNSVLKGRRNGAFVCFIKEYETHQSFRYHIGEQFVEIPIDQHSVEYNGKLSSDGSQISGNWHITQEVSTTGTFLLNRA